jgi:hypothetical protein
MKPITEVLLRGDWIAIVAPHANNIDDENKRIATGAILPVANIIPKVRCSNSLDPLLIFCSWQTADNVERRAWVEPATAVLTPTVTILNINDRRMLFYNRVGLRELITKVSKHLNVKKADVNVLLNSPGEWTLEMCDINEL